MPAWINEKFQLKLVNKANNFKAINFNELIVKDQVDVANSSKPENETTIVIPSNDTPNQIHKETSKETSNNGTFEQYMTEMKNVMTEQKQTQRQLTDLLGALQCCLPNTLTIPSSSLSSFSTNYTQLSTIVTKELLHQFIQWIRQAHEVNEEYDQLMTRLIDGFIQNTKESVLFPYDAPIIIRGRMTRARPKRSVPAKEEGYDSDEPIMQNPKRIRSSPEVQQQPPLREITTATATPTPTKVPVSSTTVRNSAERDIVREKVRELEKLKPWLPIEMPTELFYNKEDYPKFYQYHQKFYQINAHAIWERKFWLAPCNEQNKDGRERKQRQRVLMESIKRLNSEVEATFPENILAEIRMNRPKELYQREPLIDLFRLIMSSRAQFDMYIDQAIKLAEMNQAKRQANEEINQEEGENKLEEEQINEVETNDKEMEEEEEETTIPEETASVPVTQEEETTHVPMIQVEEPVQATEEKTSEQPKTA